MKLSEAIILGDMLKKSDPDVWLSEDGSCGCAFGGALLAAGVKVEQFWKDFFASNISSSEWFTDMPCIQSRWPWITRSHLAKISDSYRQAANEEKTIEDVAAYVHTIEPAEENPFSLPDLPLAEQYRMEEEAAAEEGAAIEASNMHDPAHDPRFA